MPQSAPGQPDRPDYAAYAGDFRRMAAWVEANLDAPAEDGTLYLPAMMHLLTGTRGKSDKYSRRVDQELSRRGEPSVDFDDIAAALDWCWDALDPSIRNATAERLAREMIPLTAQDSPLEHFLFHPKLCFLAAAIAIENTFLEGSVEASRVQRVLSAAESYFDATLPAYLRQLRGLAPASSLQADLEADVVYAVELWDHYKGGRYWPRVAEWLQNTCDAYFWAETEWPGFYSAFIHGHDSDSFAAPGLGHNALAGGVATILARRTGSPVAAWYARMQRDAPPSPDPRGLNRTWLDLSYAGGGSAVVDRAECPLARRVGGDWIMMRSDWRPGATVVAFNAGQPFWLAHQHYDAGQFQIWRKGRLALDSGDDVRRIAVPTSGGSQGLGEESGEFESYAAATVAHNCIVSVDPRERQERRGREWPARGNQRLIDGDYKTLDKPLSATDRVTGRLLAFETTPYYSYAAADLARAYNNRTVLLYDRHLLFVAGTYLFVVDRFMTERPDIAPTWLLHLPSRPRVDGKDLDPEFRRRGSSDQGGAWIYSQAGAWLTSDGGDGRLHVQTVMPTQRQWWIVGGPQRIQRIAEGEMKGRSYIGSGPDGFEYWLTPVSLSGGRNAWFKLGAPESLGSSFGAGAGWGRLEVEPLQRTTETVFAHVLIASDRTAPRPDIRLSVAGDVLTAQADLGGSRYDIRLTPREMDFGQIRVESGGKLQMDRKLTANIEPDAPLPQKRD